MEGIVKKCSYGIAALLVALPVMFRGLFFEFDFSVYAAVALLIIGVLTVFGKGIKFSVLTDSALVVFVALYGFTCLFGVNKGLAVYEFLKYFAVLLIYFAIKNTAKEQGGKTAVLLAVVLAAGISSVISLLSAAGIAVYPGAYSASEIEKWLNGTLQYHNAFGALTVCALFISCALNREKSKTIKAVNFVFGYFIAFGMLMSYSRGAWVTAPFAFAVYMIFADKESRLSFFEIAATGVLATIAVLGKFASFVESESTLPAVLWLLAGFVIYAVLYVLANVLFKFFKNMKHFNLVAVIVVAVVVLIAVLIVLMPSAFGAILPASLVERLSGISFGAETAKERFVFYKDAMDIAKRSILFGSGGGAWQDLYGMSQSYYYSSTQAHSFVMQVLVETGLSGIIAWLFTLIVFYTKAIVFFVKKQADRNILAAAVSGATVLIVHSFIDFDLSITAVLIILMALLGIVFSYEKEEKNINKFVFASVSLVFFILFTLNATAAGAYNKGMKFLSNGQYNWAHEEFAKCASLKPFDGKNLSYKALTETIEQDKDFDRVELVADIDRAEKLAPYNMDVTQNALSIYSALGVYKVAMDYARKIVELQPMNIENYKAYLTSGYRVVSFFYKGDNQSLAKKISDDILTINDFVEELNSKRSEKIEFDSDIKEMLMYFMVVSYNVK